uniref:Family with sequence similarity 234 member A n=1 Tax=Astyanax mexicanus TaxID=7994 RepID=A0A3B1J783_ASTMX
MHFYTCAPASLHLHLFTCPPASLHLHLFTCPPASLHLSTCISPPAHLHLSTCAPASLHLRACISTPAHLHLYTCAPASLHLRTCISTPVRLHLYTCISPPARLHLYTCAHASLHLSTCISSPVHLHLSPAHLHLYTCISSPVHLHLYTCAPASLHLRTWNRTLPSFLTYVDKQDIKSDGDLLHCVCAACVTGLLPPCLFLLAVDGTDGETLWERPLAAEFDWVQCGVGGDEGKGKTCLVAHADNFTAINTHTGTAQSLTHTGTAQSLTHTQVLHSPLTHTHRYCTSLTHLVFFSGKSGNVIGSKVDMDSGETLEHLQFTTSSGAQYLLLHTDAGLYAVGLWRLAEKAGLKSSLKKEDSWEKRAKPAGLIPLYELGSLRRVLLVKGSGDSSPSVLLCTPTSVQLLTHNTLSISWTTNTSMLLSTPSFGHYNTDGVPDVVLEEDQGNTTKRVVILDGKTGRVLWSASLLFWTQSPRPTSVLTLNSYSVFMLWGERLSHSNKTSFAAEEHSTFLLHPNHPQVLLERRNPTQNIMSFKAVLLERGRHACYLVLSGADGTQVDDAVLSGAEPVVLTKRKIKDDVLESSVLGVGGDEGVAVSRDQEESVREAFHRLRFSDEK